MKLIMAAAAVLLIVTSSVQARVLNHGHRLIAAHCLPDNNGRTQCRGDAGSSLRSRPDRDLAVDAARTAEIIGGRPAGCPHAYCGCGLRKYLGLSDVRLNLAANWARFFPHEHAP